MISNNVAFWHVSIQTSLCNLLWSLETPNGVQSVAQHSWLFRRQAKAPIRLRLCEADLWLCWSHMPHCWKPHVTAQMNCVIIGQVCSGIIIEKIGGWGGGGGRGTIWPYQVIRTWPYSFVKFIWKFFFVLGISADSVEMLHKADSAAFHLGLHCLLMYPFIGFQTRIGWNWINIIFGGRVAHARM